MSMIDFQIDFGDNDLVDFGAAEETEVDFADFEVVEQAESVDAAPEHLEKLSSVAVQGK